MSNTQEMLDEFKNITVPRIQTHLRDGHKEEGTSDPGSKQATPLNSGYNHATGTHGDHLDAKNGGYSGAAFPQSGKK